MSDLEKLLKYFESINKNPLDAELKDLQDMIVMLCEIGISPRSQARIISGMKSFYYFLELENKITNNPTSILETPIIPKKLPIFLSLEEINKIVASVDLKKSEGQRNKAVIETLYSCGLRVSELINLTFSNYFPEENFLIVIGKGGKERMVPISSIAIAEIKKYLFKRPVSKKGYENIIFLNKNGTIISRISIFNIVKECTKRAGINKNVSPHTFRHSFATHLIEGGASLRAIQEMLGHERISTTEIYTHLDMIFLRSEIINHHPRNQLLF
jgi:integrase/recombinase XerD